MKISGEIKDIFAVVEISESLPPFNIRIGLFEERYDALRLIEGRTDYQTPAFIKVEKAIKTDGGDWLVLETGLATDVEPPTENSKIYNIALSKLTDNEITILGLKQA